MRCFANLAQMAFGDTLFRLESLDSTNNYAATLLRSADVAQGTVVLSQFQEAGRGQRGKVWQASPGSALLMSVVLFPNALAADRQFALSQVVSISLVEFLKTRFALKASVKWPNDLLCNDAKLAGVLIENSLRGTWVEHSIVGIGMNLNEHPEGTALKSTSLSAEVGQRFVPEDVCKALLPVLERNYQLLLYNDSLRETRYRECLWGTDRWLKYRAGEDELQARVAGVDARGQLVLEFPNGNTRSFAMQDVQLMGELL